MGQIAFDAALPKVGPIVDLVPPRDPKCPDPGPMAKDSVAAGAGKQSLVEKIKAAFDKRAAAQRIITSKLTQLYVGWNPKSDVAYQNAVKDRTAADCDIDRFRNLAPDLVQAEERRRTWSNTFGGLFGRFFGGVKSIWQAIPWNPMWS